MKKNNYYILLIILVLVAGLFSNVVWADEQEDATPINLSLRPGKQVWVKGDDQKFSSMNWTKSGYSGGIEQMDLSHQFANGTTMLFGGSALPQENDIEGNLLLSKDSLGEFSLSYDSFRKFYDGTGGYYSGFTAYKASDLYIDDLHMDMDRIHASITPMLENLHDITFSYERHGKKGAKSLLTWSAVKEGTVTRNIAPASQEVTEYTEEFSIDGKTTLLGFDVSGKQILEKTHINSLKEERNLSTTSVPADKKIRNQYQTPTSEMIATLLRGEKWFNDDKSYFSTGYSFTKINNDELENFVEMDANRNPKNFSSAKTRINAKGENKISSNKLVTNYVNKLSQNLQFTAKLKGEYAYREGESIYPYDASPSNANNGSTPDGVIEAIDYSETKNKMFNWGQDFGVRYNGINHLSVYGNVEMGQNKNNIKEQQQNINRVLQWERYTVSHMTKAVGTVGMRYAPIKMFNVTSQYRHRNERNDFDNNVDTVGAINSGFFDSLDITADEFSTRLAVKPIKEFETGFRYQLSDNRYITKFQDLSEKERSNMISHTYTYDIMYQPTEMLFLNWSLSKQLAKTATPAGSQGTTPLPGYISDVTSVMTSANYSISKNISTNGSFSYSWTDNFDDFSSIGLPLGIKDKYYNIELGLDIKPKNEDLVIEPHYAYYHYDSQSMAGLNDYSAHVLWLDCNLKF